MENEELLKNRFCQLSEAGAAVVWNLQQRTFSGRLFNIQNTHTAVLSWRRIQQNTPGILKELHGTGPKLDTILNSTRWHPMTASAGYMIEKGQSYPRSVYPIERGGSTLLPIIIFFGVHFAERVGRPHLYLFPVELRIRSFVQNLPHSLQHICAQGGVLCHLGSNDPHLQRHPPGSA
jgi:hypothetical protein